MKVGHHFASAVILVVAGRLQADTPPRLRDIAGERQAVMQKRVEWEVTNAAETAKRIVDAYNAQHPSDLWLEVLSAKQLQRVARERTNDLAPRLLLLPRKLGNEEDCNGWFGTLKEAYSLCTNEEQRVTCLALGTMSAFGLEGKGFGKTMLTNLTQWLKDISLQLPSPALREKIQCLQLFAALGTESHSDVSLYARGTPFRTLAPLWMMSKGKWELALREVRDLKKLSDLAEDEKSTLEAFESVLSGITEKKSTK